MPKPIELDEVSLQRIACAARSGVTEAAEVEALVAEVRSLRAGIASGEWRRVGEGKRLRAEADLLRARVEELEEQLGRQSATGQVLATVESRSAGPVGGRGR